jgi:hypothetical protein
MRAQAYLKAAAGALGIGLAVQLSAAGTPWRVVETSPSWAHLAESRADAERLSDAIVLAHVSTIESGLTLAHVVPGAGYADRIPIEIVNLGVDRVVRTRPGVSVRAGGTIRLFHTALISPDAQPDPARDTAPRSDPAPPPEAGSQRATLLEDDPPYAPGERYLFYLAQGPPIQGASTFAVFAPEGRYLILNQILHARTTRGFAPTLDGRRLIEVVADQPKRHRLNPLIPIAGGIVIDILTKGGGKSPPSPNPPRRATGRAAAGKR